MRTARENGGQDIVLLKCTSTYPATPANTNLLTIPHMRELFDCEVGLSDHRLGVGAAVASVALGATVIEKHFTVSRAYGGVDSAFSLEPKEMKAGDVLTKENLRCIRPGNGLAPKYFDMLIGKKVVKGISRLAEAPRLAGN